MGGLRRPGPDLPGMGREVRLASLVAGGHLMVALDDRLTTGPIGKLADPRSLSEALAKAGCGTALCHVGMARQLSAACIDANITPRIILAANAGVVTARHLRRGLALSCQEAAAAAALGVCLHLSVGADDERDVIQDIAFLRHEASAYGLLLMVAAYVRPDGVNVSTLDIDIERAACVAVELGADVVKVPVPSTDQACLSLREMIPNVLLYGAGGPRTSPANLTGTLRRVLAADFDGMCVGRNIFAGEQDVEHLVTLLSR